MKIETKEQRQANPEGSHLCHRNVDEDNAALDNVKTEINKQPRQEDAGHAWPEHYLPHVKKSESRSVTRGLILIGARSSHHHLSAAAKRETSASINLI